MDEVPLPNEVPSQPTQPAQPVGSAPATTPSITPEQAAALIGGRPMICPICHFPVRPEYYFCPNCGAKLTTPPLGVSLLDQLLLYAFSIILPWIFYLAITKWQGIKYLRAPDARAKQMGLIALILLIVSSIIAYFVYNAAVQGLLQQFSQSQTSDLNSLGL
ncbi:MAG TPA: zinc ribbon domain-containing protein [Candidatus Paceibacterota bacterium]